MQEQLVSFETAKLAKEKGFDWYDEDTIWISKDMDMSKPATHPAPTQSLLQKWLYEEHTIWVQSNPEFNANEMMGINVSISSWRFPFISVKYGGYDVYEGLEMGLQEALKLI